MTVYNCLVIWFVVLPFLPRYHSRFDCLYRNPCRPPFYVHGKFKYPNANESQVFNCLEAEDFNLGCVLTSCRPQDIYNDHAQACKPRTYDCADNGGNPCTPPAIEGKTVYPNDDKTKKVQCTNGRCEVIPCPRDYSYNDAAQKCLPNRYDCDARNPCGTKDSPVSKYIYYAADDARYVIVCHQGYICSELFCQTGYLASENHPPCRSNHDTVCSSGEYWLRGQCFSCPPGTVSRYSDRRECNACTFGTFQPYVGSHLCNLCEAGTFADSIGSVSCMRCSKSTFQNRRGQRHCIPCAKGHYQDELGQISCKRCRRGFFADVVGRPWCAACWDGVFQQEEGAFGCVACPHGTYTDGWAQTSCQTCPAGYTTRKAGSGSIRQCSVKYMCTHGLNPDTGRCIGCPAGHFIDGSRCLECNYGTFSDKPDSQSCKRCATANRKGLSECPDA